MKFSYSALKKNRLTLSEQSESNGWTREDSNPPNFSIQLQILFEYASCFNFSRACLWPKCGPSKIRTCDLRSVNATLWPAEPWVLGADERSRTPYYCFAKYGACLHRFFLCRGQDLNLHAFFKGTRTSILRVYQFHHLGIITACLPRRSRRLPSGYTISPHPRVNHYIKMYPQHKYHLTIPAFDF